MVKKSYFCTELQKNPKFSSLFSPLYSVVLAHPFFCQTEAIAVDPLEAPKDLTLCRFLVVIDDILDVPQAFLDDAASRDHSLELSYEFLGAREAVRLESPVREGYSSTASGAGKGYDRSSSCSLSSRRRAVRIPVHSFRSALSDCAQKGERVDA